MTDYNAAVRVVLLAAMVSIGLIAGAGVAVADTPDDDPNPACIKGTDSEGFSQSAAASGEASLNSLGGVTQAFMSVGCIDDPDEIDDVIGGGR